MPKPKEITPLYILRQIKKRTLLNKISHSLIWYIDDGGEHFRFSLGITITNQLIDILLEKSKVIKRLVVVWYDASQSRIRHLSTENESKLELAMVAQFTSFIKEGYHRLG